MYHRGKMVDCSSVRVVGAIWPGILSKHSMKYKLWEQNTDKKENKIFRIYYRNSDGIMCKVIYEKGLPNIWGNAQIFSPYMRRSLVIYDFAPVSSKFPNIWGNFYFLFLSVNAESCTVRRKQWHFYTQSYKFLGSWNFYGCLLPIIWNLLGPYRAPPPPSVNG